MQAQLRTVLKVTIIVHYLGISMCVCVLRVLFCSHSQNWFLQSFVEFVVPKMYIKMEYCVSCAIHSHIVRTRSKEERRNREPPQRYQPQQRQRRRVRPQPPPTQEVLVEGSKAVGRVAPVVTQQQQQ
jgi:hypothetical protein